MSSPKHSRDYRRRLKAGEIVLRVRVPEVDLTQALIEIDRLDPRDEDNREALARSVEELLAFLVALPPDE